MNERIEYALSQKDFVDQEFGSLGYDGIVHARHEGGIIIRAHSREETIYTALAENVQNLNLRKIKNDFTIK